MMVELAVGGAFWVVAIYALRFLQVQRDLIRHENFQRLRIEHLEAQVQELRTRIEMMKNGAPYR